MSLCTSKGENSLREKKKKNDQSILIMNLTSEKFAAEFTWCERAFLLKFLSVEDYTSAHWADTDSHVVISRAKFSFLCFVIHVPGNMLVII